MGITQDVYDRKEKELRYKQHDVSLQLENLVDADQSYHITAKTVLSLAQRAEQIFDSSEIPEKRQLLEFVLQNPEVKGKNLEFTIRKPFDLMAKVKGSPILLRAARELRTVIQGGWHSYAMDAAVKVLRNEEPFDEETMRWMEKVHPN